MTKCEISRARRSTATALLLGAVTLIIAIGVLALACLGLAAAASTPRFDITAGESITASPEPEKRPILLPLIPDTADQPDAAELVEWEWSEAAEYIAKTIWGEARGCSVTEQAAVAWCILNRVDSDDPYYPDDIIGVVTQPLQFLGYDESNPAPEDLGQLAIDVIDRWLAEKAGEADVGRVLPKEYLWFGGDGSHNWFRDTYELNGSNWDWSLPSPYEEGGG